MPWPALDASVKNDRCATRSVLHQVCGRAADWLTLSQFAAATCRLTKSVDLASAAALLTDGGGRDAVLYTYQDISCQEPNHEL